MLSPVLTDTRQKYPGSLWNTVFCALDINRLKLLLRASAVGLGALHAWTAAATDSMNPDGVAYLNMGEAYVQQDWSNAVNSYWSPLYSWLLGLTLYFVEPSMRWEFPVVHLVNFLIYLFALVCFEFLWFGSMPREMRQATEGGFVTLPDWAWIALGYSLFLWSSVVLIRVWHVTPDMLVAALIYLAAGLVVRIRSGLADWRRFALLGVVLGFAYLAKAALFPLAFIFLAVSYFSVGKLRRAMPHLFVGLFFFFAVSGPFIAALSSVNNRLTFGDAGKLMYAWYVNGIPYPHWQGEIPGGGTPINPSRKILNVPPVYEFAADTVGTYPISYNPPYWYQGVTPQFNFMGQIKVLLSSVEDYFQLFFREQAGLIVGLLVLYFLVWRERSIQLDTLLSKLGLGFVSIIALAMYALVHVQSRYVGVFIVLLWADLLAAIRLADTRAARQLVGFVSAVMLSFLLINVVSFNLDGVRTLAGFSKPTPFPAQGSSKPRARSLEIAEELHRLGVRPGDKVAVIGYAFNSFWARLARVQIVAEMFDWEADTFWFGNRSIQDQVIRAFASTGAKVIVAEHVPHHISAVGWHQIGGSSSYVYFLSSQP